MNIADIKVSTLKQIIKLKGEIERAQGRLARLLGAAVPKSTGKGGKGPKPGRRKMSAAARAKIAKAARARWAKAKAAGKKRL